MTFHKRRKGKADLIRNMSFSYGVDTGRMCNTITFTLTKEDGSVEIYSLCT